MTSTHINGPVSENKIEKKLIPSSILSNFDKYEMRIKPFILPKPINSFFNFIMIFEISIEHPQYNILKTFLTQWMNQANLSIYNTKINFDLTSKLTNNLSNLSDSNVYFCDTRSQKDNDFSIHLKLHPDKWINDIFTYSHLSAFRGLFVFTDNIKDVPSSWVTKSIGGLTGNTNINKFLEKGLGSFRSFNIKVNTDTDNLNGYIKMIQNSEMVTF